MIKNGELELMIQRWMTFDDGRGVGEALNETDSNGNGEGVKLKMKFMLEGKERWFDENIPWAKQA